HSGLGLRPKNIGARIRRREDPRLLTGQGQFTDDREVAGALHLAFRRSDHPHALIVRIDSEAAAAMPGVVAIYTAQDLEGLVAPVGATRRMPDYQATRSSPLAAGRVRYVGEPVVAVLAADRYLAEDAAECVEIAYQGLPALVDSEAASAPEAPLAHEETGT